MYPSFPKYLQDCEYDHHEKPTSCVIPCHQSLFPPKHDINDKDHDGDDMFEVSIHLRFKSLIVDISIFWLEERIQCNRLHPFALSSPMILHEWLLHFTASRPCDLPCFHSFHCLWICCMSKQKGSCFHIDWIIYWLHWVYDYT